jgi:hypothetical protein
MEEREKEGEKRRRKGREKLIDFRKRKRCFEGINRKMLAVPPTPHDHLQVKFWKKLIAYEKSVCLLPPSSLFPPPSSLLPLSSFFPPPSFSFLSFLLP